MTDQLSSTADEDQSRFEEFSRTKDPALRDVIIESHLGLANQLARRFGNRGEAHDDLVQVASMALVKAVDRFEPERGVRFSTFAVKCILGELKRHFRDRGWAVRAPRRIQELYLELGHEIDRLVQELGRAPTVAELAVAVRASEHDVLEAMEAGRGYRSSSLDAPDQEGEPFVESLGAEDRELEHSENRSVLAMGLEQLSEKDRLILELRFVDGLTQSDIASRFGVSQMQVSRMLASSLKRLRANFED
ncbi:MAG: SigB/SigF/SigG family RNA polymerase sigma factor [Acidimicrobiales bacterium]|jgi:RNA polymerase sigma-B factor